MNHANKLSPQCDGVAVIRSNLVFDLLGESYFFRQTAVFLWHIIFTK
jgi:hypothetical protein